MKTMKKPWRQDVTVFVFCSLLCILNLVSTLDLDECGVALGMETGEISDGDIMASSSFDVRSVGPQHARIRTETGGGAWCPERQIRSDVFEWLQIDLKAPKVITAIETQGRYDHGVGMEYTPTYAVEYWRSSMDGWHRYKDRNGKENLLGNNNTFTPVFRAIDSPFVATKVRIIPLSDYIRTVCLRVELYGCSYTDRLESYQIMQGYEGTNLKLRDESYDGRERSNGLLIGGLGQLFNGFVGQNDVMASSYEWVGWQRSISGFTTEMMFKFSDVRNFSSISIHFAQHSQLDARVFSAAHLFFSVNGEAATDGNFLEFRPDLPSLKDGGHWIDMPTNHQVGNTVFMRLFLRSKWFIVSEVRFQSTPSRNTSLEASDRRFGAASSVDADFTVHSTGVKSVTVFAFAPLSTENITLIVGAMFAVLGLGAIVSSILLSRQKRLKKFQAISPHAYRYNQVVVASKDAKATFPGDRSPLTRIADMSPVPATPANANCAENLNNVTNLLLEKLPAGSPPFRYNASVSNEYRDSSTSPNEETSEYADPDGQLLSNPTLPLIPPPPFYQKRRSNTHSSSYLSAATTSADDCHAYSLYYASSDITSPEEDAKSQDSFSVASANAHDTLTGCTLINRRSLLFQEKLGAGEFGEVHLCLYKPECRHDNGTLDRTDRSRRVAVKLLRLGPSHCVDDFDKELRLLSKLSHPNIVKLLGVCADKNERMMVFEYMENGDLNQYLKTNRNDLTTACQLHIASQIVSAMKYLESINHIHRDLATRNCLVGKQLNVKVGDFGMARSLYSSDYYRIEGNFVLPIRWMAWECVLLGKFTPKTDVWSFGVTLWEVFTFAEQQPFAAMNDTAVIENLQHLYYSNALQAYLEQPCGCSDDVYELMLKCWRREDVHRPTFREIDAFLTRKLAAQTSAIV